MFLTLSIHVNIDSMVTILSLKDFTDMTGVHVTLDTARDREIILRLEIQKNYIFNKYDEGIY